MKAMSNDEMLSRFLSFWFSLPAQLSLLKLQSKFLIGRNNIEVVGAKQSRREVDFTSLSNFLFKNLSFFQNLT